MSIFTGKTRWISEYHLFESVSIPDGKVLCPGVITHASNIVEHPELICERIMRFANRP